jgi:hypothetical protein
MASVMSVASATKPTSAGETNAPAVAAALATALIGPLTSRWVPVAHAWTVGNTAEMRKPSTKAAASVAGAVRTESSVTSATPPPAALARRTRSGPTRSTARPAEKRPGTYATR